MTTILCFVSAYSIDFWRCPTQLARERKGKPGL
jgi:hypothetical protein